LLKNFEKVLKEYFKYLFRYLPVKLWGAVGSYQVHSIAQKSYKMLSRTPKNPKLQAMWERTQVQAVLWKINSETQVNKGKNRVFSIT